jgi:hypothetical protein
MERNCLEILSRNISPDGEVLVLPAQFFIFWQLQVEFSFCAEALEENPAIRKQEAVMATTRPVSIQFFFFISAGLVMGRK